MTMRIARPANMITTAEVAMIMEVSRNTVLRLARNGILPSVRRNERGDFLFDQEDVMDYMLMVYYRQLITATARRAGFNKPTRAVESPSTHIIIS